MASFNLSSWALRNQALVLYSIILLAVLGILSYRSLGQAEDPPFTFKVMVVQTQWPGATALEISDKVTEAIEKKLQEIPELDYLRSYSSLNLSEKRMGEALRKAGFERRSKRVNGNPVYGWVIEKITPNPFVSYGL